MENKIVLKIIFKGDLRYISCDCHSNYGDIIKIVMDRFAIPTEHLNAITITTADGNILEKNLLKNYIILFPQPEIIFYIRMDYKKLNCDADGLKPANTKHRYEEKDYNDNEEIYYEAVPVVRQNCFIGELPPSKPVKNKKYFFNNVIQKPNYFIHSINTSIFKQAAKCMRNMDGNNTFSKKSSAKRRLKRSIRI